MKLSRTLTAGIVKKLTEKEFGFITSNGEEKDLFFLQ